MDIYWAHVAQHRFQTYTAPDGSTQTNVFDPGALVAANTKRYPLFHAKDGSRTTDPPGTGQGYVMVVPAAGLIVGLLAAIPRLAPEVLSHAPRRAH